MSQRLCLSIFVFVSLSVACAPTASDNTSNDSNNNASTPGNDNGLSTAEEELLQQSIQAAMDFGAASAALSFSRGVQDAELGGAQARLVQQLVDCPDVSVDLDLQADPPTLNGLIDFGSGCMPNAFPTVEFAGSISGQLRGEPFGLSGQFDDFASDDRSLDGSFDLTISNADMVTSFDGTVDLTTAEDINLDVQALWTFTPSVGEVLIESAEGVLTDNSQSFSFSATEILITAQASESLIPVAGEIEIVAMDDDAGVAPGIESIVLSFTEDSPESHTVLVSINGSDEFSYMFQSVPE